MMKIYLSRPHLILSGESSPLIMIETSNFIHAKIAAYSYEFENKRNGHLSEKTDVLKSTTTLIHSSSTENKEQVGVREVIELEATPQHIDQNVKILVVGNPKCGKSSLIKRFVSKGFESEYISTIGADYQRKDMGVTFMNDSVRNVRLQLWDIAGQDRFQKLTRLYFKNTRGVIIVCDVSRERTVDAIKLWKSEIDSWIELTESYKIPIVLFANKADLLLSINDAFTAGAAVEKVSHELGVQCWWTTSALSGAGVSEGFAALLKQIIEDETSSSAHTERIQTSSMTTSNINASSSSYSTSSTTPRESSQAFKLTSLDSSQYQDPGGDSLIDFFSSMFI